MQTSSRVEPAGSRLAYHPHARPPVVLERIDRFVARTQNWFYEQLRTLSRHRPVVICDRLENREEFPDLEAIHLNPRRVDRRLWRKVGRGHLYPPDVRRLRPYHGAVFHSHHGYVASGDARFVNALGMPWVVSFYGADVYLLGRDRTWQTRYHRIFARATRVLALGPAMSAALQELGCPHEKLRIHPLGVDAIGLPHQPRILVQGEPLRILFAATMREKKGAIYLIEALGRLHRKGIPFRLQLVGDAAGRPGDDETKAEVFRRIGQLGLDGQVEYHSWLPIRDLIALGLASHVFVAPSVTAADGDSEGCPTVITQMMATSMAIIATRHSDIPYIFGPHADTLIPERDAGALADRLEAYSTDPERLTRDGIVLREHVLRTFDLTICVPLLSDIYEGLAPGVSGARPGRASGPADRSSLADPI